MTAKFNKKMTQLCFKAVSANYLGFYSLDYFW